MPFYQVKKSLWRRFVDKLKAPEKEKKHALALLNLSQFLGVINDNVFKFVMAFLLIDALGQDKASSILSATGAIYVIPFLLFSSSAGILADRFSKQRLLLILKGVEIVIMGCAVFAFYKESMWMCYSLLFLLAAHSAMFGPSKYGIIPELVPADKVSKANGLVTSFTYLAIIIGTFLASFLTEITHRHFTWIALFCLLLAIGGFFAAILIHKTPSQGSTKNPNFLFISEIYKTLMACKGFPHLLPAIFGSAFFLFLGAFTQLNIIPFAIESLHFNEVAGGYLFLPTALGIALGSVLSGKFARKRLDLAIPCLAGFGIVLCFLLLSICSTSLTAVIIALLCIGVLGGIFIVPFDSFIQLYSENQKRGQTIAAANFLSFGGVLIASFSLFFFNGVLGISSAHSFAIVGGLTFFVSIALSLRLSHFVLPFIARKLLFKIYRFKPLAHPLKGTVVLENYTVKKALLLLGNFPDLQLFIPTFPGSFKHKIVQTIASCTSISSTEPLPSMMKTVQEEKKGCLCLKGSYPKHIKKTTPLHFFIPSSDILLVRIEKEEGSGMLTVRLVSPSKET